jgi:predicted HAD superfamily Cof-like phosphohydrolase
MSRDKSFHQERVEQFMAKANQHVPSQPTIPDEATRRFRAKIILEEALETIEGLGFYVTMKDQGTWEQLVSIDQCEFSKEFPNKATLEPDLIKIVDGCADVRVVTTGTLSACGVADEPVQEEVDESNLRKFGPGSYKREDGKWMKPPDFRPPDIEAVLAAQAK